MRLKLGLIILSCLILSLSVYSYNYEGYKWDSNEVNYYITSSIPDSWESAIDGSTDSWSSASAGFNFAKASTPIFTSNYIEYGNTDQD